MLLVPVKSFSGVQEAFGACSSSFEAEHELAHLYGVSHHHTEDGVAHYDDSSESSHHFSDHAGAGQLFVPSYTERVEVVFLETPLITIELVEHVPHPYIELLTPPPRLIA